MLSTSSIEEFSTSRSDLFAFRLSGQVTRQDVTSMARYMNEVFDAEKQVDILLYFEQFDGFDADAVLDVETAKSQARALSSVRRYVVANAPGGAAGLLDAIGQFLPVEAESFEGLDHAFKSLGITADDTSKRAAA